MDANMSSQPVHEEQKPEQDETQMSKSKQEPPSWTKETKCFGRVSMDDKKKQDKVLTKTFTTTTFEGTRTQGVIEPTLQQEPNHYRNVADCLSKSLDEKEESAVSSLRMLRNVEHCPQSKAKPKSWSERFAELQEYKKIHGNCLVPSRVYENPGFGKWVSTQRLLYKLRDGKQSARTQERLEKLEAIGFEWQVGQQRHSELQWSQKFDQLVQYKETRGNCLVRAQHKELGSWVRAQRYAYKKSELTRERVEKLEAIGFQWQVRGPRWSHMFDELVGYKEIHGNCLVHQHYNLIPGLANWVSKQRIEYIRLRVGKNSPSLTQERVEKLEDIGFEWKVGQHDRLGWSEKFEELIVYKETNGNCLVPQTCEANRSLGNWVDTQRRSYWKLRDGKPTTLTEEKVGALEAIGFKWGGRKRKASG